MLCYWADPPQRIASSQWPQLKRIGADMILRNEYGVPQYPKGHVGRLLVALAAIDHLEQPTSSSVAKRTGLSKGKIDNYVEALNSELGTVISKTGSRYRIESWGSILNRDAIKKL